MLDLSSALVRLPPQLECRLLRIASNVGNWHEPDIGKDRPKVSFHLSQLPGLNSPNATVRRRAQRHAMAETDRALRAKLTGATDAPNVIIQAHLALPLGENAEEAIVRPDLLVAGTMELMYRPGEIKSFAALRHLTDEKDVASAEGLGFGMK